MEYPGTKAIKDDVLSIPTHIDGVVLLAVLLIASMYSPMSVAREWYAKPSASLRGFYDDNLLMRRTDQGKFEVYGGTFSAGSKFGMRTETSDVGLTAQAIINRYDAPTNIDNENYHFNLDSSFNVTERNQFTLNGRYFIDNNIGTQFEETGLTQFLVERTSWAIQPNWTYRLSETENLILDYSHEEIDFEQNNTNFLNSYNTDSVSLNYTNQWTERLQWFALASYLRFETPRNERAARGQIQNFDIFDFGGIPIGVITTEDGVFESVTESQSDMYSIQTGFNYAHSETWTSNFMIGGRWTESESFQSSRFNFDDSTLSPRVFLPPTTQKDSGLGYLISVGTNKQFERSSIGASFFQDVRPTAQGQLMQFTGITLTGDHKITEHLKFSLNASATQQTTAGGDEQNTRFDRDFISVEPKLSWRIDRQMTLAGGYRYRWQEFAFDTQARESNSVYFQLNYNWDPFTTSRY
ncbi:MAG: hypothetical protein CVV06_07125 [Gammaproteobacteria bacterium HGW-Gammaproteobacteria-10]|nr:MAG: hypothetical protein CVV06_07125 [Gammaproteobacteria bacterium HGW-Gammaproteobacteria-10]